MFAAISATFSLKRRVGLLFGFQFLAMGLFLPYFAIFLADRGLDDTQIGLILAIPLAIRIATGPLIAAVADRFGRRAAAVALVCALSGIASAGFLAANGFAEIVAVTVAMSIFHGAIIPLSDAYAMDTVRAGQGDYGRMRLWGSIAFMAATLAGGAALEALPSTILPLAMAVALLACTMIALTLPEFAHTGGEEPVQSAPRRLRDPIFLTVLAAAALAQGSHAAYYAFGSLHWRDLGIGETTIGVFWVIGVLVEVGLFTIATRLGARMPPLALIAVGAAAGVVRWTLFPLLTSVPAVLAMQTLHGLTFGATHLGLVAFIASVIPARRAATAQGLGGTFIALVTAAGTLASGWLYAWDPASAYWAMAAGCALALGLLAVIGPRTSRVVLSS